MINVIFCRNGRVADVTGSYAACEKGRLGCYNEILGCSERISSNVYNDSSGGRELSARAIHLRKKKCLIWKKVGPMLELG